jgi:hypothetical protein
LRHELGRRFLILKYPNANPLMSETVGIWGVVKLLKEISLFRIFRKNRAQVAETELCASAPIKYSSGRFGTVYPPV